MTKDTCVCQMYGIGVYGGMSMCMGLKIINGHKNMLEIDLIK